MFHNRMDSLPLKLLPLEHKVLREARKHSLASKSFLVAVSGGQDSILALHILSRLQPILNTEIYVAHIHHGAAGRQQLAFRNRARIFVKAEAEKLGLAYFTNRPLQRRKLNSEAEFRDYRFKELNKIIEKINSKTGTRPILALGHHQDDQIETQVLRLLRGTGARGLIGMEFYSQSDEKFRPLLYCTKKEVNATAKKLKLKWCEDPSNENIDPLRNWLRQKWLVSLENKIPGAKTSLARSFSLLAKEAGTSTLSSNLMQNGALVRTGFLELSRDQKAATIAQYLRILKIHQYTQGQIEEICRCLDNRCIDYTFVAVKYEWRVDARRIQAFKL